MQAQLDFVRALPNGFDTYVGSGGWRPWLEKGLTAGGAKVCQLTVCSNSGRETTVGSIIWGYIGSYRVIKGIIWGYLGSL